MTDEHGTRYKATYPKRAKGLVKKGRARFIDEYTICLACPPEDFSEENNMTEEMTRKPEYTVEYILAQIEEIHRGMDYIIDVVAKLESVRSDGPGDIGAEAKAQGFAEVVRCRETTNQQILRLYEKMYDNLICGGQSHLR